MIYVSNYLLKGIVFRSFYMTKLVILVLLFRISLKITDFEEVREKSSHYGLHMLGFTRATRANTKRGNRAI